MPKEETIQNIKVNNKLGERSDLSSLNPRASLFSRLRAMLLKLGNIPQLIHLQGALEINKTITLNISGATFAGVMDIFSDGTYLYAATESNPGQIVKIDLSDFTQHTLLVLNSGENGIFALISDGTNLYAGLGGSDDIVKIRLSDFTRVSKLSIGVAGSYVNSMFSDGSFIYAATNSSPAKIVKVNLDTFVVTSTLTLEAGENDAVALFSDGSYLYAGIGTSPGKIVKINLDTFTRDSVLTLATGENDVRALFSDGSYLYASTFISTAKVIKIDLSNFTKITTLTFAAGENNISSLFSDGSYLYAGLETSPAKVVKIDLSNFTKVITLTLASGEDTTSSLYSDGTYLYTGLQTTPGKIVRRYVIPTSTFRDKKIDILYNGITGGSGDINRVSGKEQVIEVSVTSAANAGDVTLATVTSQPCLIKSITIHADAAQTSDLTSCAVKGSSGTITFIDEGIATQANLNATDKQVSWNDNGGYVRMSTGKTIVMTLSGSGGTAVDLTVSIIYCSAVNGGYLV